ncbi:hypothetical protein M2284_004988 [Rhodococcus sp. LBL1]|nr:hypothetical protein [Rhodococcus sp. LBL1]MDH6684636.1 hypothetical protein [Rhodococcus sp. LBL2]
MTASDRISLNRASAESVPVLADLVHRRPRVGVVGIEVRREGSQSIPAAVAVAANALSNADPSLLPGRLVIVGVSQPLAPVNRLGALMMKRESLWNRWQNDGTVLPPGDRHDFQLNRDDERLQFGGWLMTDTANLGAAVEVSRDRPAVCLLLPPEIGAADLERVIEGVRLASVDGNSMVRHFVPLVLEGAKLVRGFGSFDDRVVGTDVYADEHDLDDIQSGVERWMSDNGPSS